MTPEEVVAAFFAAEVQQAREAHEAAAATLQAAHHRAATFAELGQLPDPKHRDVLSTSAEIAGWVTNRATRAAIASMRDRNSEDTEAQYQQIDRERRQVLAWLLTQGYDVPTPFRADAEREVKRGQSA